jgi:hypothetical protein
MRRRAVLAGLVSLPVGSARGADLVFVMVEHRACPFCRAWHRAIGPIWPRSDLGRRAPLRRVELGVDTLPAGIIGVTATPTFVLLAHGREIGRILGYQGETLFWQQAEALFARADEAGR